MFTYALCLLELWRVVKELFYLGTRRFGTPRHNCILVSWGYETQQRLMWTKVHSLNEIASLHRIVIGKYGEIL